MQIIDLKSDKAEKLLLIKLCVFNRYSFSEGKGGIRLKMEKENVRKANSTKMIAFFFAVISALIMLPSIIFNILYKNHQIINYVNSTIFFKLIDKPIDEQYPIFLILAITLTILFLLMCKFRNKIFNSTKTLIQFIIIIGAIYAIMIPTSSLDIYTYIARGRMQTKYHENPYYTSTLDIMNKNPEDKIMYNVARCWWGEKATYGPYWELIVKLYSLFSGDSIFAAIYVYKVMAFLIFILSVFLIKKISNNDLYVMLFGLNPYILYQFLANAHNDFYVIFFVLLAIYLFKVKNNKKLSVASLAVATSIKYYPVLFVPFLLFYFIKDEKNTKGKISKLALYSIEYLIIVLFPYIFYAKDINAFLNPLIQQTKYSYSLQEAIFFLSDKNDALMNVISKCILVVFVIYYLYLFVRDFFVKDNITFEKISNDLIKISIFFIVVVLTCYNSWYIGWIVPFMLFENTRKNRIFTYWELSSVIFDHVVYNPDLILVPNNQLNIVYLYLILIIFIIGDLFYYSLYNKDNATRLGFFKKGKV